MHQYSTNLQQSLCTWCCDQLQPNTRFISNSYLEVVVAFNIIIVVQQGLLRRSYPDRRHRILSKHVRIYIVGKHVQPITASSCSCSGCCNCFLCFFSSLSWHLRKRLLSSSEAEMMSSVQQCIQLQDVNHDDMTASPDSSHPDRPCQLQCKH